MKPLKTLIAFSTLATATAFAQSSVTLYGAADAGIGKIQSPALGPNDASNKTQMTSGSLLNNTTSNIGFAGQEDLGGGTKAGFNFETNLDLEDGSNLTGGAGFWARQARLWMQGPWGTFQMGRTYNPSFLALVGWQLTAAANYSVVGDTFNWGGGGTLPAGIIRQSSLIGYQTPNMSGFGVNMAYVMKNDNLIPSAANPQGTARSKWDVAATYVSGPLVAALTANRVQDSSTSFALGGKYKIGQFAVAASYHNAVNINSNGVRRGFSLGGQGTFGLATFTLDLTRDTKNEWAGKKFTNALAEARYSLSKRTFVYAAYLHLDNTNSYGVGVRHNF